MDSRDARCLARRPGAIADSGPAPDREREGATGEWVIEPDLAVRSLHERRSYAHEAPSGRRRGRGAKTSDGAGHRACHGLIDAERPGFSSFALTADGEDDGFLTVLEVFRSTIPADLVVLSACETVKGKVVKGEGIMGLTRAFLFAGAPRVICSLWKVDDDATKALMERFHEPRYHSDALSTGQTARATESQVENRSAQAGHHRRRSRC